MCKNKNHWYDGKIYDKLIAPNQDKSFQIVRSIVTENSSVLDVGSGTGRFAFQLSDKCRIIDGIDLSRRNIDLANSRLLKNSLPGVSFHHADVQDYLKDKNKHYDFAVISYVLHEMDESERKVVLSKLSDSADRMIIVDYLYPRPRVFWSILNEAVEFMAGRDHYRNFRSFVKNGGIAGLVGSTGLQVVDEIKNNPATSHVVLLKKV